MNKRERRVWDAYIDGVIGGLRGIPQTGMHDLMHVEALGEQHVKEGCVVYRSSFNADSIIIEADLFQRGVREKIK
jgi:hypothetical protein